MLKTKFTELVGIDHPIMQGGMQHLGVPELAAAVSNSGGLGTINITIYPDLDDFRAAIRQTKSLTAKPFAVNISLTPELNQGDRILPYIRICQEEGVKVIETAGRSPSELVEPIKEAGIIWLHKCTTVKHAKKAVQMGADAVTVAGYEVAGHPGMDEIGIFVLANRVSSEVPVPVLAAGGIADGRALAAALALGAAGVAMGTRFVASQECQIHPNFKELIVASTEMDTTTCQRSIKNMVRCVKNQQAAKVQELERDGATLEQLMPSISGVLAKAAYHSGDTQHCLFSMGLSAGCVHAVKPVRDIIQDMVQEAADQIARLDAMVR